jgi:hypothetical protein
LHLKTSIRSFRSEHVAKFVNATLDCDRATATDLLLKMNDKYLINITRNIQKAKEWLKQKARSNERYGLVASSKAQSLKPYGIFVEIKIDPKNWFLNLKDDIRSSYFLEYVATEFYIQRFRTGLNMCSMECRLEIIKSILESTSLKVKTGRKFKIRIINNCKPTKEIKY